MSTASNDVEKGQIEATTPEQAFGHNYPTHESTTKGTVYQSTQRKSMIANPGPMYALIFIYLSFRYLLTCLHPRRISGDSSHLHLQRSCYPCTTSRLAGSHTPTLLLEWPYLLVGIPRYHRRHSSWVRTHLTASFRWARTAYCGNVGIPEGKYLRCHRLVISSPSYLPLPHTNPALLKILDIIPYSLFVLRCLLDVLCHDIYPRLWNPRSLQWSCRARKCSWDILDYLVYGHRFLPVRHSFSFILTA